MASRKKLSRKELLKKPDEFISITGRVIRWVRQYQNQLMISVGAVFLVALLYVAYQYVDTRAEEKAFAALHRVMTTYEKTRAEKDAAAAYTRTHEDFEDLIQRYKRRKGGEIARLVYAQMSYAAGDVEQAISLYEAALKDVGPHSLYRNLLLSSLGYAYEKQADFGRAVQYFEKIVQGNTPLMKDVALFSLGRLYARLGDAAKSEAAYDQLAQSYPDFIYQEMVREKLQG